MWAKNEDAKRIFYVLYPLDTLKQWIDAAAERYNCSIVVITGMDWDNDLTPWPAPGAPAGSPDFKGLAPNFLNALRTEIMPKLNDIMDVDSSQVKYDLIGVSLSGLFTLWQWIKCDVFQSIACISGSFWYKGFAEWLAAQKIPHKDGRAYFSLGDQESRTPVPEFKSVAVDTQSVIHTLKSNDITTEFRSVPGNHFQHGIERLNLACEYLSKNR